MLTIHLNLPPIPISEKILDRNNTYIKKWNEGTNNKNVELDAYSKNNMRLLSVFGYRLNDPFIEPQHDLPKLMEGSALA